MADTMILDITSEVYFIIIYNYRSYREEWDGWGMYHVWRERRGVCRVWWGNL